MNRLAVAARGEQRRVAALEAEGVPDAGPPAVVEEDQVPFRRRPHPCLGVIVAPLLKAMIGARGTPFSRHRSLRHSQLGYPPRRVEPAMNVETIARAALADFLGGSPDEVAFGANRTTLTFHLR